MDAFVLDAILRLNSSEYDKGLNDAINSGSKIGSSLKTAFSVGAAAIGAATTAVTAFAGSSVKVGMNFDQSMSQVAATMGVTVDEIEELRDFAQEMGSTTAFSASQAADALNYMALAGYDAETSMNMLPNVLNLAAAGGIELAYASDMVTDASSALGLNIEETAELVDKMAKASSKTNTSVSQLGDAILTVGGTAKNLSGGTTELAQVLGILADNGIKASESGTHLRNIMLAMNPLTTDAAHAFTELGVQSYDAEGNLRPLQDIFLEMNEAMAEMTDMEKQDIITAIFNKTDLASVNALLATTAERWDEVSAAIDDAQGAAEAMAGTQLDNLAGDITLFQSALEGAKIAVSDQLTPTLRELVQFGADGISKLTVAFKEDGVNGAMEAFGEILTDGLAMLVEGLPDMVEAGASLLKAIGQGISDNIPLLTETAIEVIMMMANYIIEALPSIIETGLNIIVSLAQGIAEHLPELIPTIVDVVLQIVDTLTDPDTLGNLVDAAIAIMIALAEGLIDSLPKLIERAPEIVENLVTALVENAPKLLKASLEIIVNLVQGLFDNLPQVFEAGGRIVAEIISGIFNVISDLWNVGKDAINEVWEGFTSLDAKSWGKDLISNFVGGITSKWEDLKSSVKGVAQTVKDFLGFSEPKLGPLSNFSSYAPDMMELFAKGIRDNEHLITDQIEKSFDFGGTTVHGLAQTSATSAVGYDADDFAEAIRYALAGVGVYMDGQKVGILVNNYQRSNARAYGR